MGKRIYFYINDDDLTQLLQFLTDNNLLYHTKDNIRAIDTTENHLKITCKGADEKDPRFIRFSTSGGFPHHITEALIVLDNEAETDEGLKKAFKAIKKYIQTNYRLSQTKEYYFAPGIYQDWLDRKIQLPVFLEFEEFTVEADRFDIREFITDITDKGYIVRTNFAKLRVMNEVDADAESMVIYTPKSKLFTTVINRNFIRYDTNSECIRLYKTKKKKKHVYQFVIDKRISEKNSKDLADLFESLSEYQKI